MHRNRLMASLFAAALILSSRMALAHQNEDTGAPAERDSRKGATLLVMSDVHCTWKLDGVAKGKIGEESVNAGVEPGTHSIQATGEDGLDTIKIEFTVERGAQKIVLLQFAMARAQRENAEIEERKQRRLEQEKLAEPSPAEKFKEALAHFEKQEYALAKPLLRGGCTEGNQDACVYLARIYSDPLGANYDKYLATALFSRACDQGNSDGCAGFHALSPQPQTQAAPAETGHTPVQTLPPPESTQPTTAQASQAVQVSQAEVLIVTHQSRSKATFFWSSRRRNRTMNYAARWAQFRPRDA